MGLCDSIQLSCPVYLINILHQQRSESTAFAINTLLFELSVGAVLT
jgi:hypothetical protein